MKQTALTILLLLGSLATSRAETLWERGYSVIPQPRNVQLADGDVIVDAGWAIDAKVDPSEIAVRSLRKDLADFHHLTLNGRGAKAIRLRVAPGTVVTKADPETDKQAYRLRVDEKGIEITGNGRPGLFYGVQTLVQLLKRNPQGKLSVPRCTIDDWPAVQLRFLHWDHQQHQDRIETLKRYLDWAARFKANMIAFQLEDKFEFPSHPIAGAPGAFTTAQLQEITNYGLERHIQVVPLIQAPAHFSWALKHPEFASLRADGNNYQACMCDPKAIQFIFDLYDDVIKASKGVDYLYVSTDEVYYAGICEKCGRPYNPENRSLQWVDFVRRARDFAKSRGRRILIWDEYPLLPKHVDMLPADVIAGVIGNPAYLETEKRMGMRHIGYTSMEGLEYLFPDNFAEGRGEMPQGRLNETYEMLANGRHWKGNPIGVFGAAWDASGLHNETFWLGWSAVAQWAWNPGAVPVDQHAAEFMRAYYGPRAEGMVEIYRLMQRQARGWELSWDKVPSRVRGLAYGNSRGKGVGTQRYDETLSAPPLPSLPELEFKPFIGEKYAKFLSEARQRALESDRLLLALQAQFPRVDRNRYNLEVMTVLARLIAHHWRLLESLVAAEGSLQQAHHSARANNPSQAVSKMVTAYEAIGAMEKERAALLQQLKTVFEKSMYPRGRSVGGRNFVDINDDTKDYWAQRRTDLSYMTAPEESIELGRWRESLVKVIKTYAAQHGVEVKRIIEIPLE